MGLLVADLACKNLGNCHSALIISKKLKKNLKNQQLLRFMREVKSLCKEPRLSWRETYRLKQRSALSGGRLRAESWAGTSARKGCLSREWNCWRLTAAFLRVQYWEPSDNQGCLKPSWTLPSRAEPQSQSEHWRNISMCFSQMEEKKIIN